MIRTYAEFWPFYVSQHLNPVCRRLHFAGTSLVILLAAGGLAFRPLCFALMPVAGYGFAWAGHFIFEKNRPATFRYPIWSLRADFRMFGYMLSGKMAGELARVRKTA